MCVAFFLTVLPYTIRNYRDSGRFVLVSDAGGGSYLGGTEQYNLIRYPWNDPQWAAVIESIAERLHVGVSDLALEYWTIDDRFNPELNKQAHADLEATALHHPLYLAKRTTVMAAWFLVGDYPW